MLSCLTSAARDRAVVVLIPVPGARQRRRRAAAAAQAHARRRRLIFAAIVTGLVVGGFIGTGIASHQDRVLRGREVQHLLR